MLRRIRSAVGRGEREPDPLVKVAGMPTRHEADASLETLQGRGIIAELREDAMGAFELWAPASVEPLARLLLGLSGRSVIRVPRRKGGEGKKDGGNPSS